eukprot:CAMPEP_0185567958 /NCGR_PEP_ID=MMETSP0434-20130131/1071_1 /TAXON_ID=626734 ORGANISM="Favella taraikaensis, Strain Fe Narragansett Bay" /NCGR_SAMPLE_ID=MMETSP0434 /ASSEMBLY_ACC=CAM_ASM_000379 /LENGTH=67 /DNA_ID=CAMNT_0028182323 /DNA_START=143 /DNA_END=346 /DNA_ORIENTATION=-
MEVTMEVTTEVIMGVTTEVIMGVTMGVIMGTTERVFFYLSLETVVFSPHRESIPSLSLKHGYLADSF